MSSGKALAIKRINKEMKEISDCPLEGIGIISLDNNPMKYIVNICIMSGINKSYCIQLLLTFPDDYPINPPKILVFPKQNLESTNYNKYFGIDDTKDENGENFKKFCFKFNYYSGWNPSISLSSLLVQIQNYIGDPEIFFNYDKNKLKEAMKSMESYKRKFIIKDEKGEMIKIHTWETPYPEMFFIKEDNKNKINEINKKNKYENYKNELKENLTCFLTKFNYIDNPEIILGYSIVQKKGKYKQNYELYTIPELLTYEAFMAQFGKTDHILKKYYYSGNSSLINDDYYNYWIPIYLNKDHYLKNKTTIINSFTIFKLGIKDIKEYYFKPEQFFDIFPTVINKIITGINNNKDSNSILSSFIKCYFHYALLFKKIIKEYEADFSKYLNHILNLIHKNKYNIIEIYILKK